MVFYKDYNDCKKMEQAKRPNINFLNYNQNPVLIGDPKYLRDNFAQDPLRGIQAQDPRFQLNI